MSRTEHLEQQIAALEPDELRKFREWFSKYEASVWDSRIERDVRTGALDRITEKALRDHEAGRSTEL